MGWLVRRTWWCVAGTGGATRACLGIAMSVVLLLGTACTDTTLPPGGRQPAVAAPTSSEPDRLDPNFVRPHTRAGADLLDTFPAPAELGPGWAYVDPPAPRTTAGVERDVEDVVVGSVPGGCLRLESGLPPLAAAEVSYAFRGTPVTASRVGFDDPADTRAFFGVLDSNLVDCTQDLRDDGGDIVGRVVRIGPGILLSNRFPDDEDARRTDLAVLTGTSVVLLEAPVAFGREPFTSGRSVEIAKAFRRTSR